MTVKQTDFGVMVSSVEEFHQQAKPIRAWIRAALLDGWDIEPTYKGEGAEGIETACRLTRDGWIVSSLRRPPGLHGAAWGNVDINMWGPDRGAVAVPLPYPGFEELQKLLLRCHFCNKIVDKVHNVAFASRACAACLPAARKKLEYPGWSS